MRTDLNTRPRTKLWVALGVLALLVIVALIVLYGGGGGGTGGGGY